MKNWASERVKLSRKRKYAINAMKELEGYAIEFNRKDFAEKFDSKESRELFETILRRIHVERLRLTIKRSLREINRSSIVALDKAIGKQHEQNFEGCWNHVLKIVKKRNFSYNLRILEIHESREKFPTCILGRRAHRPERVYQVFINPP